MKLCFYPRSPNKNPYNPKGVAHKHHNHHPYNPEGVAHKQHNQHSLIALKFIFKHKRKILGLTFLIYFSVWFALPFAFPYSEQATSGESPSLIILDRHHKILHHESRDDYFRLLKTDLTEIPSHLIQATIAAEDKRFYSHSGVDFLATLRAIKDGISAGRMVSGASTITQQTIKLSTPKHQRPARNFKTKIIESFKARHLELTTDKDTILTSYFNHLDYGNHMLGPKQAALFYFGRSLDQLSLAEHALLAGIPQSPTRHNPRINPEGAKKRRNWVLDRMEVVHSFDSDIIARAKAEPITLQPAIYQTNAPFITQFIKKKHANNITSNTPIITTIDAKLQQFCQDKLRSEIDQLKDKNVNNGAIVVIDNRTREILVLVGSRDFHGSPAGQINAALIPRSPGSVLKPFGYLLAFEELKMQPATLVPDIETYFPSSLGKEEFVNYSRTHSGPVTIFHALGNSLNIPIIRIINQMGGSEKLLNFYRQLGFTNLTKTVKDYGLGLAIGGCEVSLLDATNAFATISNSGIHTSPTISPNNTTTQKQLFSAESSYLVSSIMNSNQARSDSFSTHSDLRLPFHCAVKTGTSTDFRDNWCIGYTKDFTVGVWVGNLDHSPMKGISGITGAGPIFNAIMKEIHNDNAPSWISKPDTVQAIAIDPHTGKTLTPDHPRFPIAIHTYAKKSNLPHIASPSDYDPNDNIYLPNIYKQWLDQHPTQPYTISQQPSTFSTSKLRILHPSNGNTIILDPDLPNQGASITLSCNSANNVQWSSPSLNINNSTTTLTPGSHTLTVTDLYTQQEDTIQFNVISQ